MNTPLDTQRIVAAVTAWWRDRSQTARQLGEIGALTSDEFAMMAADCGVSPMDLHSIIKAGPHGADEMNEMLVALNIDPAAVQADQRPLYREMAITCAECGSKAQCRRDLRDGTAPEHYNEYCANADVMNELRAEPEVLHG